MKYLEQFSCFVTLTFFAHLIRLKTYQSLSFLKPRLHASLRKYLGRKKHF